MQENCRSDNPARGIVLPAAERRKIDLDADRYAAFGRALAAAEARGKRWQAVAPPRSGRLAYDRSLGRAEEHHPRLPALARPRAQSGREHWQYLRQNRLSKRVFETYEAIIEAACDAWRSLLAEPTTITSIGHRGWAHVGQKKGRWYNEVSWSPAG